VAEFERYYRLIRQDGHDDIAATIREAEYDNAPLLALLRLTPPR
jgi:hypothetical protein